MTLFLHFKSLSKIFIFLISLYLSSLSIIENVLMFKLSSLTQYEAITEASTPPLKHIVNGTSDLVLNLIEFCNSLLLSSRASF